MADGRLVSVRLNAEEDKILEDLALSHKLTSAAALRLLVRQFGKAKTIRDVPEIAVDIGEHLLVVAARQKGKTTLVFRYLIQRFSKGRRVVVFDSQPDDPYWAPANGYEVVGVNCDLVFPPNDNPILQFSKMDSGWSDANRMAEDLLKRIEGSGSKRVAVQLNFIDDLAEEMFMKLVLKRLDQRLWDPPLLVVVEEMNKYDCPELVARGSHHGIACILTSQEPLPAKTMNNLNVIVGSVDSRLAETIDPDIAYAAQTLQKGEWLFECGKRNWLRFRHILRERSRRERKTRPRRREPA